MFSNKFLLTTKLNQKHLGNNYCLYNTHLVLLIFIVLSTLCFPLAVIIIVASNSIRITSVRYDHVNKYMHMEGPEGTHAVDFDFNGKKRSTGVITRINFSLNKTMTAPIMMQYGLKNFHQNYMQYTKSMDYHQLQGGTSIIISSCSPFRYPGEFKNVNVSGHYSPCGAVAWSLFNDSISLYKASKELICNGGMFDEDGNSLLPSNKCVKKGIAPRKDIQIRQKSPASTKNPAPMWTSDGNKSSDNPFLKEGYYYGEAGHKIPSITDEDLIVWTNLAYLPTFHKNYRIINVDLEAGDYYFEIVEKYSTVAFSGKKYARLVSYNGIGEKHYPLGFFLLSLGCFLFVNSVSVLVLRYIT